MFTTDPEIIVAQLVEILDFADSHETKFGYDYYIQVVCFCHLSLIEKTNNKLLPFLYIIRRYKNNENVVKMLESQYNQTRLIKQRVAKINSL